MNAIKVNSIFAGHYAGILSEVATLAVQARQAQQDANAANTKRRDTLADKLREYARQTAADGVSAQDARDVLRVTLSTLATDDGKPMIPAGTVKGYGATFAGFRDALDAGEDINAISVKDAQARVASDETKALNAARAELRKAIKSLNADGLMAVVSYAKSLQPAESESTESAESEADEAGEPARQVA